MAVHERQQIIQGLAVELERTIALCARSEPMTPAEIVEALSQSLAGWAKAAVNRERKDPSDG